MHGRARAQEQAAHKTRCHSSAEVDGGPSRSGQEDQSARKQRPREGRCCWRSADWPSRLGGNSFLCLGTQGSIVDVARDGAAVAAGRRRRGVSAVLHRHRRGRPSFCGGCPADRGCVREGAPRSWQGTGIHITALSTKVEDCLGNRPTHPMPASPTGGFARLALEGPFAGSSRLVGLSRRATLSLPFRLPSHDVGGQSVRVRGE